MRMNDDNESKEWTSFEDRNGDNFFDSAMTSLPPAAPDENCLRQLEAELSTFRIINKGKSGKAVDSPVKLPVPSRDLHLSSEENRPSSSKGKVSTIRFEGDRGDFGGGGGYGGKNSYSGGGYKTSSSLSANPRYGGTLQVIEKSRRDSGFEE